MKYGIVEFIIFNLILLPLCVTGREISIQPKCHANAEEENYITFLLLLYGFVFFHINFYFRYVTHCPVGGG